MGWVESYRPSDRSMQCFDRQGKTILQIIAKAHTTMITLFAETWPLEFQEKSSFRVLAAYLGLGWLADAAAAAAQLVQAAPETGHLELQVGVAAAELRCLLVRGQGLPHGNTKGYEVFGPPFSWSLYPFAYRKIQIILRALNLMGLADRRACTGAARLLTPDALYPTPPTLTKQRR